MRDPLGRRDGWAVPDDEIIRSVREGGYPVAAVEDLGPLLDRIGDSRIVMLGEASHGTAEYYEWRTRISQRLIQEKGFTFIAVEGDWPDCYHVNRYVKALPESGRSAREVLRVFERWPTWMWANEEIVELAEWLRGFNESQPLEQRAGFYGLDMYSLWESMDAVVKYLQEVDPDAVAAARRAYTCFEPFSRDGQEYATATALVPTTCEDEAVRVLAALRSKASEYTEDGRDAYFDGEQNALVARSAEMYYRTMVRGGPESWNVRDRHMAETLRRLLEHHGPDSKAIVWEHNTHIGDARAADMAASGMVNLGQLAREEYGVEDMVLVGFGSYEGSVIAGDHWGAPMERMQLPPARDGTYEQLMHEAGTEDRLLVFSEYRNLEPLLDRRGHRAVGVVYNPARERYGNYVPTVLALRYDAFLYLDTTQALHPLNLPFQMEGEMPETYPSGV